MQSPITQGYPTQCPVCSKSYDHVEGAEMVAENRGGGILHLTCSHCESAILVALKAGPMGIVGMGSLTDLNKEEAKAFLEQGGFVSEKEVLSMYRLLKKEKLGVQELFSE